MHRCALCGVLYCSAECSVKNWRRHKRACASGRDEVFKADVAYGLRASHLTSCVVCDCGCARPAVDPRVVALGLGPVIVVRSCRAATTGAPVVAELAVAVNKQSAEDVAAFGSSITKIQEAVRDGKYNARPSDIARLWTDCRVLFKTLYRCLPRIDRGADLLAQALQADSETAHLLKSLRSLSAVGLYIVREIDGAQPTDATRSSLLAFTALASEIECSWGVAD
jgi:hypothetical protein